MINRIGRVIAVVGFAAALIFGGVSTTQARNGADDGPGHHKGEHHKGEHHKKGQHKGEHHKKGHHKGEHHKNGKGRLASGHRAESVGQDDDGPNHDVGDDHGQGDDDGPNHDVGDDHGQGDDDGPNHDVGDDHGNHGPDHS